MTAEKNPEPRKGPSNATINAGLDLLAEQLRAEGHDVLEVNHLPPDPEPRCEPESLRAYTDADWPVILTVAAQTNGYADLPSGGLLTLEECRAAVAELDRMLGELTEAGDMTCLALSQVCPWVDMKGTRIAMGVIGASGKCTPLGRACLARAAQKGGEM